MSQVIAVVALKDWDQSFINRGFTFEVQHRYLAEIFAGVLFSFTPGL